MPIGIGGNMYDRPGQNREVKSKPIHVAGLAQKYPEELFTGLDEEQCDAPRTAADLKAGGIIYKTPKEYFTQENPKSDITIYGKTPEYNAKYIATKIDNKNYIFEITYNTPTRRLITKYNSKEKNTYIEFWQNNNGDGNKVKKNITLSKYNLSNATFEQSFEYFMNDGGKAFVKQKHLINGKGNEFDAALYNPRKEPLFKVRREIKDGVYAYNAYTLYPKSPDASMRLEYTIIASSTENFNRSAINEIRVKDKNGKEWIFVGRRPYNQTIADKYFKRSGEYQEIKEKGISILVPYDKASLDNDKLFTDCFGCDNENTLMQWLFNTFGFFKEVIDPIEDKNKIFYADDYYPVVKDYQYDNFKWSPPGFNEGFGIKSFRDFTI